MRLGNGTTIKPGKANPIILGLLFIVIGGFVFFMWDLPPLKYASTSKAWPSVSGEITRSEVETYRKDGKTQYLPDIEYKYSIDGKNYTSSRVTVGDPPYTSNISPAKRMQAEYPEGKSVDVFYDPEVPSSSALRPGIQKNDILLAVIIGIFPILGILILVNGLRAKIRKPLTKSTENS